MKRIDAIIQPHMFEHVIEALERDADLPGITVSDVRGWGRTRVHGEAEGPAEARWAFARRVRIEVVVSDDSAERVVAAITASAHTGHPGDGKIFVSPIEDVVRIRGGERGSEAL